MSVRRPVFICLFFFLALPFFARTVKVGYFEVPGFMEGGAKDEKKYGYAYEYIEIVSKKASWTIEYEYGSWAELYDKFISGEIDLMPGVSKTPDREGYVLYPDYIMGKESYVIYKRKGNSTANSVDVYSLNSKKIGVPMNSLMATLLRNWTSQRRIKCEIIYYSGERELARAMDSGDVDCICTTNNNVTSSKGYVPLYVIGTSDYYFAVTGGKPEVLRELNQALARVTNEFPFFIDRLQDKYFSDTAYNSLLSVKKQPAREKLMHTIERNALATVNVVLILLIMLVFFIVIYIFSMTKVLRDVKEANIKLESQMEVLKAMSDIYFTSHLVNLQTYQFRPIKTNDVVETFCKEENADKVIRNIMSSLVTDAYMNHVMNFVDFATVKDRLRGKKSISTEFVGKLNGWCRITFITVHVDYNRVPTDVLFNVEVIEEEKKNEENLKRLSRTDILTGLGNRNAFEFFIRKYEKSQKDYSLSVFAMDLDGLKRTNDTIGHDAGDELLKGVSEILKEVFYERGNCFRIGGDEFAVILSAEQQELNEICTQIDRLILEWHGEICETIHISYGYACLYENPEYDIPSLLKVADSRMYEMKRQYYEAEENNRRKR